ncbi:MAG: 3,4-dihydroxy-2-butanone-4-phosphate synthase [Granulosicoccus sp.]|nr:3,4-dihydroxy-2-butanone-4-phosphate synthase [Granulosicoccus sp.]
MTDTSLSTVETAIEAYRAGRFVIIVDDDDRENEGDLAIAADHITPEAVNFMATHGRGLICLAMRAALLDRLQIPMMVPTDQNRSGFGTGFTISIEAVEGVSTGISAFDRSHTIKTLIDPKTTPNDIAMPGHIFPLRARDGGVLERRGQTEASVDLSMLSGLTEAGVICEVMSEDGTMALMPELQEFGKKHDIPIISVEALAQYRSAMEKDAVQKPEAEAAQPGTTLISRIGSSTLPTEHGQFDVVVFRDQQGLEHSALLCGDPEQGIPIVRLHSECLTGDALGSLRCDCGAQLKTSLQNISEAGHGILLYLRQEGRGIGLGNKIRAYALQDEGMDTVDANLHLGFPADGRHYDVAAAMLKDLGADTIKLMTNNPSKREGLEGLGIAVDEQLPLVIPPQKHNQHYLQTKAVKMGHDLPSQHGHDREPADSPSDPVSPSDAVKDKDVKQAC